MQSTCLHTSLTCSCNGKLPAQKTLTELASVNSWFPQSRRPGKVLPPWGHRTRSHSHRLPWQAPWWLHQAHTPQGRRTQTQSQTWQQGESKSARCCCRPQHTPPAPASSSIIIKLTLAEYFKHSAVYQSANQEFRKSTCTQAVLLDLCTDLHIRLHVIDCIPDEARLRQTILQVRSEP